MLPHPLTNFEIKNIIGANQDLMEFFQETVCLKKNKGWGIRNKA